MPVDAEKLRKQAVYEAQAPLQSVLDDLDQIGQIAASFEARRRTIRHAALWCLLGFVLGLIIGAYAGIDWLVGLAFLSLAFCIGLFIWQFRFGRKIIANRKRGDLLKELLASLQWDVHERATFAVRLSLDDAPLLVSEAKWTGRRSGKQFFYKQSWLTVEAPMLDGATLSEEITELSRKRTYLNPRGKRKIKNRSRYLVTLRLIYPKDRYGDARPAHAALPQPVKVPEFSTVRDVRVTEKAIAIKALVPDQKAIPNTAEMLSLGAYRILNLARRAAARQGGAK
ncbi:MAG TPA: hypothetical protein VKU01_06685 [Bryobacteraceae bacterium]|nr:hypothetical protein [Bryobacteraceae bacterium]